MPARRFDERTGDGANRRRADKEQAGSDRDVRPLPYIITVLSRSRPGKTAGWTGQITNKRRLFQALTAVITYLTPLGSKKNNGVDPTAPQ